ncbi:hypothetical protein IP91_00916 [Pseudoduganella lurida]|uniref:DUF998 domain-containing protein n=1 Tax=Pseudoduganella lurida TaxID=1036180 RepID=A0A562RLR9_9BURK|nr:DUF998 domain-containing protein [Pseudoduganella lurida]TWI69843.1 hypothetical protein IP91_00916 [Pseudoduganella lurida]
MHSTDHDCVASYRTLSRLIGWAGLLMPAVVRVGALLADGVGATDSLSAYYYTSMRDIFVSTTVLTGVLLLCYRTAHVQDTVVATLAGLAAIGLALFPMDPVYAAELLARYPDLGTDRHYAAGGALGYHLACAVAFAGLSFYLVFFRFGAVVCDDRPRAAARRLAYRLCGAMMLLSFAAIAVLTVFDHGASYFWPETCAVSALAVAWLVKGEALLKEAVPAACVPAAEDATLHLH